jgi:crotonobetainyl-CoA:carnitine CoA-transferase CaiB-like acyl-CoA transferase
MSGPLAGIKVVELSLALVGPWAGKLLGAMGADVVKLEDPAGELTHGVPPYINGTSASYISANLNKRHVTCDLKDPETRECILSLLDHADVFIENMRPGTVDRLGIGYETVSARNPRIVFASASAYGSSGPMATQAGADPFVQAYSGWCSTTGSPGGEPEMLRYVAHLDLTTAAAIADGVLHALYARERTGQGQRIELEMLTTALAIQTTRLAEFFATGVQPAPAGSADRTTAPHEAFCCEDRVYLAVAVVVEDQWPRFCKAMGFDEAFQVDPRFASNEVRMEHREQLSDLLAQRFATKPSLWWRPRLVAARVPNACATPTEVVQTNPQVIANDYVDTIDTAHWGPVHVDSPPWRFHGTPVTHHRPGGLKGEHNDEVLGGVEWPAAS